jgi:hypothetical protein
MYVMHIALTQFPSPLMGEGQYCSAQMLLSGAALVPPPRRGKENDASLANRVPNTIDLPPPRGEGVLTSPCQSQGGGSASQGMRMTYLPSLVSPPGGGKMWESLACKGEGDMDIGVRSTALSI